LAGPRAGRVGAGRRQASRWGPRAAGRLAPDAPARFSALPVALGGGHILFGNDLSDAPRRMFASLIASLAASLPLAGPAPVVTAVPAPVVPVVAPQRGRASDQGQDIPPIQEEGDYFILNFAEKEDDEGMTLYEFVKACEQATGLQFIILQESSTNLQNETVRMIGTKRIPKRDFYSFFQIIMFIYDYSCVEVGAGPTSVIVIQANTPTGGRGGGSSITQKSIYVLPEELEEYADQPATQITTVVNLPNTDVRNLSNSLRTLQPDTNAMNIVPAGNSDSLILRGYGSYVVQIARLLYLIDKESEEELPPMPVFEYVPLEFASADEVADMVEQLVEAQREFFQNQGRNRPEGGVAQNNQGQAEVKIVVDRRTNSLAITALPDDMPRVKDLIARLDTEVIEPERNYHIYALENVGAEDISEVLSDFLDDAQRITQSNTGTGGRTNQGGTGGGGSSGSEDVVVIAEPGTNSLLIAANKTRYAEVLELIEKLDRRADQVLIETAIIELTGDEFQDIGVELGFADLPGVGETGGFGITSFGLSTLEDLDLDGIPDASVPTFANGLTAGILDGDDFSLPFLVRFLKTRDNANVLSVPSVLVNNNGSATVETKDETPFTQVTAFGGAAGGQTQENFQGYEEAGIKLTISPSISASRYLRLGVELEVSNFLGATTAANIPPARVTRNLNTTINVPDGDTMVIGGVITNNTTSERTQLPWLGDIPVLGALFRRDVESSNKRTLYFFVTPHILADEDFADLAQISYEKKLDASEVIGSDRLRVVDPDFGISDGADDLLGFEVPLYTRPPAGEISSEEVGLDAERRAELLEGASAPETEADPGLTAEQLEALESLGYVGAGTESPEGDGGN
jgi:general secretion pathway protein D